MQSLMLILALAAKNLPEMWGIDVYYVKKTRIIEGFYFPFIAKRMSIKYRLNAM